MDNPNEIARFVFDKLTIVSGEITGEILKSAEEIRDKSKMDVTREEFLRVINMIESFPAWQIYPHSELVESTKIRAAQKADFEKMQVYQRLYKIGCQKKISYSDFKRLCQNEGIEETHILTLFAATKFNSGLLSAVFDDNQAKFY